MEMQLKAGKKPKREAQLKSYITEEELSRIRESSQRTGLSVSEFIRRVCLGFRVESREDQKARLELLKGNADLGRLGGLLKQALAAGHDKKQIYMLLRRIDECQFELNAKVREL